MSDLTRYRLIADSELMALVREHGWADVPDEGWVTTSVGKKLVPDDSLQQIADAWNEYSTAAGAGSDTSAASWERVWRLLNGLVSDE